MSTEREITAELIRVRGTVQGVGFRPTVWRLARGAGLTGEVWNDADGVGIRVCGERARISAFVELLQREPPPLARIESIERSPLADQDIAAEFVIVASHSGSAQTDVAADAAVCDACLGDIARATDRRYRYPFTNCTHCGPRLSIVRTIPYDRANTSMARFPLCPACQREYADPADRRFHAQPNACPVCGPRVWLESVAGGTLEPDAGEDPIRLAQRLISDGAIVAIDPLIVVSAGLAWLGTLVLTGFVSLASMVMGVAFPVAAWLRGQPAAVIWATGGLTVLILVRHRSNMRKLLAGTESRSRFGARVRALWQRPTE